MSFAVGSLVRARGREWVVLSAPDDDFLELRPLGGSDAEIAGVCTKLETVEPARFDLPDPAQIGDHRTARLLRDASRIASRAGAGPFRSFARIAVEPRPYQLVPLMLALRLDPVRLLIADDVGIGKTVEAALIARELLDRGEVERMAVLCPPHLAEQWQRELSEKFHIEAELVLPSTAASLERRYHLGVDETLFDVLPHTIVSLDFIKAPRRRADFVRTCPELVIVDEAHTCAFAAEARGGRQLRHELLKALTKDDQRHVVLVTATPHSGNDEAFRSLLSILDPSFADLPSDLTGKAAEPHRRRLARHLVQRRRKHIRKFLETDTAFPDRLEREESYKLTAEYRKLFERVIAYARESASDEAGGAHRQRVRWWSALALLRSLASSPAAAAETLRNRAAVADTSTPDEADELGRRTVFDDDVDELDDAVDVAPGAQADAGEGDSGGRSDERLLRLAREAEKLAGPKHDAKLSQATAIVKDLIDEGHHPIVFCRFIPSVEYVADALRKALPEVEIDAITGRLAPADREARVEALGSQRAEGKSTVLVCTDCLSEGINLQEHFDAVVHYDLAWNPTRHEQREGRVDRFGQPKPEVRVVTLYGVDNQIDGIVLDVLLRKHQSIRKVLGVSVPVPVDTNQVMQSILEGLLLRKGGEQEILPGLEEYLRPQTEALHGEWQRAADREDASRSLFAQLTIQPDEVHHELEAARESVGSPAVVRSFTEAALRAHDATLEERHRNVHIDLERSPRALRDLFLEIPFQLDARFDLPVPEGVIYLSRTHPLVAGLASYVLDTALDSQLEGVAARAGAIRTDAVATRTTVLLCRFRYDLVTRGVGRLAEECGTLAFESAPESARWLEAAEAEPLLDARPTGNVVPEQARELVAGVVEGYSALEPVLRQEAQRRAEALEAAHGRVRQAARASGATKVAPQGAPDVLGIYVLLPAAAGNAS